MEIRNRLTGEVTTVSQFKLSHPNTSFPNQITADLLDSYNYDPVLNGAAATVTPPYGVSVRDGVEQIDGQWFTRYVAGPLFTDNEEATAAEQETAYRSRVDAEVASSVRNERNSRLAACDWTQLSDSSANSSEWATYRQQLRDLPSTEGFPHSVTWPTKPS
jgi:hypothetical protein